MANQNVREHVYFASMYFSRMGEKQWRQKMANTPKITQYTRKKEPKTVKIIQHQNFRDLIMYFLRMEFKSRKIEVREKNTFYSIPELHSYNSHTLYHSKNISQIYSSSTYWAPSVDDKLSPNPSRLKRKYPEKKKDLCIMWYR